MVKTRALPESGLCYGVINCKSIHELDIMFSICRYLHFLLFAFTHIINILCGFLLL